MLHLNSGKKSLTVSVVIVASLLAWWSQAAPTGAGPFALRQLWAWLPKPGRLSRVAFAPDTPRVVLPDTSRYRPSRRPKVAPEDRPGSPFAPQRRQSPLLLDLPSNVNLQVTPDDSLEYYDVREKVGADIDFRDPSLMTFQEYSEWQQRQAVRDYFRSRSAGGVVGDPAAPETKRLIPKIYLGPMADRLFGGSYVDIRPNGAVTLRMGARFNRNLNPTLTLRQQRVGDFQYEQNMNLNLTGQIGEKLRLTFNYDTKAAFDFENNMKLDYTGFETEIIRKIELGNVSLPLNNSLIQGGQNLFGVKTQLQFGKLAVTAVASTLRGTADAVSVQNGAQSRNFEIKSSQYERDRHFFLAQFFRDRYDAALRNLPTIQSGVEINNIEVYVTNDNRQSDNLRNVVGLMDLAEPVRVYREQFRRSLSRLPADNGSNREYQEVVIDGTTRARSTESVDNYLNTKYGGRQQLTKTVDYERVRARLLNPREYTLNPQLGYLSLNTPLLPEQVLAVAYTYTYNGKTYSVGELSTNNTQVAPDQVLYLKMLKASNPGVNLADPNVNTENKNLLTRNLPTWDLMMKNIYALNASQLNRDNFQLQIVYKDDATGVDLISLKEGQRIANRPIIEVLNLDNVNPNNDQNPDGNFDFFPGTTIDPDLGKIIFPVVEPFGSYLRAQFDTANVNTTIAQQERDLARRYVYQELYTQTQSDAQQRQEKDKFFLRGRFQATATDEISLPGLGIAEGSVRVTSGSTVLEEGRDYQVFYDQAKVKILNASYLNSANELKVSFEKNALVQVQPRKLLGARFDYRLNQDVNFGATVLHLLENQAPGINRVNIGDEPGNNTIYGFDVNMRRESRALTKYLDMLPLISTKEPSSVAFSGEIAQLVPGKSKLGRGEDGVSYIDDFENARTPYSLGGVSAAMAWRLAATPITIPKPANTTDLGYGFKRAKLAWYTVDQTYYTGGPGKPSNINDTDLKDHYTRGIQRTEIFPNRDVGATGNGFEFSLDLAYFPKERGQYNYNPAVSPDGKFLNPDNEDLNKDNYGGISREITFDTDFDNANVEYMEFWMMDPFIGGDRGHIKDSEGTDFNNTGRTSGGELYLNLGSVSEDLLTDANQHEFENGLPTDASTIEQDTKRTPWGRVTRQQFLTDAFSTAPGGRDRQDIGLEGLDDNEEKSFFAGVYSGVADPSADNFRHHLDDFYTNNNYKILGRYKQYNGMEGNSRENSQLSSTALPDKEDLNRDNVISDTERYYEWKMSLRPDQMEVGQNYIVDKVTNSITGDQVSWYQFRIPIRQPSAVRGATEPFGFKSIRFVRMYLTGWDAPVVLRLVQPQFVANQWRRFLSPISQPGAPCLNCGTDNTPFTISTVSIEENGIAGVSGTDAIPYVLPPNIQRDKEYGSSTVNREQNEQSLRLCVEDLRDGVGKAAYKNINISMLRYKQLRLFLHAESEDRNLGDNQVRAFVRIGTDYTQNYYEYSLPLRITRPGATGQREIWPEENEIQISFQQFIDAKAARNQNKVDLTVPYVTQLPNGATITILGNPDFSAVQGVMIGVLNPADDNAPKSLCLWADEFRVFDFERENGWAATARFNTKLADLANVTATGSFTSVGFGGLQDKVAQRSLDNVMRGDLNAAVAADKFLPEKLGLRIPVLVQAGQESRSPKYDPLDPDTKLEQSLQKFESAEERAAYRKEVIDQTSSRSISLLNVRKERVNPEKKVRPYDVENFALSYALTERTHTDIRTDRDYTKTYTGALAYVYQTTPKNYTPLAKIKALDSPYLKIFQDLNFTPLPSRFAFRADLDRRYNERQLQRTLTPGQVPTTDGILPIYQKSFFFNRIYDLKWDLTKSLIFDYTATNRSVIDEGAGPSVGNDPIAQANRLELRNNLLRGGRTTNFNQTVALTYRLPLDKFPLTDWLSADTRYAANYSWQAASTALRAPVEPANPDNQATEEVKLGNTIQNNAEISANGKIDLVKLYNKVRFLNIINNAPPPGQQARTAGRNGTMMPPSLDRLKEQTQPPTAAQDTAKGPELRFLKAVLRSLMTARSLNFTYTRSTGTLVPGYLPGTRFFGLNQDLAPGIPFVLGQQYNLDDLYNRFNSNGWYTRRSDLLNTPFSSLLTENLTLRTALEPFRDFNIQLDGRWQRVRNNETFYRLAIDTTTLLPYQRPVGDLRGDSLALRLPQSSGTFSTSFISIRTLFGDRRENGAVSKAFNRFIENRGIIRDRLQQANERAYSANRTDQKGIYGYNSQEVLIPAFIDAYQGRSSDGYKAKKFNPFALLPVPNWRIDYNGLAELPFMKRYFRSITLNHQYASSYTVASYTTSTLYSQEPGSFPDLLNISQQFIPYYVVGQVTIAERLSPLIGVNFQTLQKVTGRVELRTERGITLSTTNNAQVTELHSQELVIGFGYATNRLKIPFRIGGEQRVLKNELTARLDLSIRDNTTIQRTIEDVVDPLSLDPITREIVENPEPSVGRAKGLTSNGTRQLQLRPTIDYVLNQRLNLQIFFSRTVTEPRGQNSFKNSATEGGLQLRYSLSQ
ncbi:T9SS outer membrane translocon Sov/SprA [Hymenobacter cellulosivorans]|uniref:Cell surface protein SprA n=1 Tax=Hymenobacter cellulosivorans TaxID=2932249 RepID=A0ABY4F9Z6_9BACT|nr:cell surface protein SprA [Hymenobacter cellulosivorans]UOQ53496.1 cell surface protein SprA [Hymenobacter cellulosivorans]